MRADPGLLRPVDETLSHASNGGARSLDDAELQLLKSNGAAREWAAPLFQGCSHVRQARRFLRKLSSVGPQYLAGFCRDLGRRNAAEESRRSDPSEGRSRWAALPAKPQIKDGTLVKDVTGKVQYTSRCWSFDCREVRDAFSRAVVQAVLERAPEAFNGATSSTMTTRPPITIPPALDPLTKEQRWVGWRWIKGKDGKLTKPPFRADAPHLHASSTDPSTWSPFEVAMGAYCRGQVDGIGFALSGSELAAEDLDDCRIAVSGVLNPWAAEQIRRAGSYAEVTPSNEGVRVIGLASGSPVHREDSVPDNGGMSCELYRGADRYISITGRQIGNVTELGQHRRADRWAARRA